MTNFSAGGRWVSGVVVEVCGSSNYMIKLEDGRIVHRHIDQMVRHHRSETSAYSSGMDDVFLPISDEVPQQSSQSLPPQVQPVVNDQEGQSFPELSSEAVEASNNVIVQPQVRSPSVSMDMPSNADDVVAAAPAATVPARASKVPLERRAPSTRTRNRPGYLRDYEV